MFEKHVTADRIRLIFFFTISLGSCSVALAQFPPPQIQTTVPLQGGSVGFEFGQGSRSILSSTSASITTLDGYPGSISVGTIRPFVTGVTPIVGDYRAAMPSSPVINQYYQRQQAYRHSQMLQAAKAQQQQTLRALRRAQRAEEEGNLRMARANYRRALATAQGPLRWQLAAYLNSKGW